MRAVAAIAVVLAAVSLGGCSEDTSAEEEAWLAAVAGDLTVEQRADATYLLLSDPTEALLFTDRPFHRRIDVGPEAIVGSWSLLGFGQIPPNAAISVASGAPVFTTLAEPAWTDDGGIRWRVVGGEVPEPGPAAVLIDDGTVDSQITDAVTQTNVTVVGEAPAQAMALVYQSMADSISLSMQNAQQAQGGMQQIGNAVTSQAVQMIMATDGQGVAGATTPTD